MRLEKLSESKLCTQRFSHTVYLFLFLENEVKDPQSLVNFIRRRKEGVNTRNLYDSQSFLSELEKNTQECLATEFSTEVLSRITPNVENPRFLNFIRINDKSQTNLVVLYILSHYVPEILGWYLRMSLEEEISNTELGFLVLMETKYGMQNFLLETTLWSSRDFFGNILTKKNIIHALNSVKPVYETKKRPKRVQQRRGYRDKGTLRKNSDKHDLWYSTAEQWNLEQERLSVQQTIQLLQGFVT